MKSTHPFLPEIALAKAFAILLVVLGHTIPRQPTPNADWLHQLHNFIYSFHMPFFMFLSGFIFFYTLKNLTPKTYLPYLIQKAERLLLSFFLFGIILVFGKFFAGHFLHVDNPPENLTSALTNLIYNTRYSAALSIWYLFVLFIYVAVTPALFSATRQKFWPLILLAAPLPLLDTGHLFYTNRIAFFYIFFLLGGLAYTHQERLKNLHYNHKIALGFLFIAALLTFNFFTSPDFKWQTRYIIGLTSLLPLYFFSLSLAKHKNPLTKTLEKIAPYVFVIYLLNTICIGVTKGILLKFIPWNANTLTFYLPFLTLAGIIGPIIAYNVIIKRIPYLRHLLRG